MHSPHRLVAALALTAGLSSSLQAASVEDRLAKIEAELARLGSVAEELQRESSHDEVTRKRQATLARQVQTMRENLALGDTTPASATPTKKDPRRGPAGMTTQRDGGWQAPAHQPGLSFGSYGQGWYTGNLKDKTAKDSNSFDMVRSVLYAGYRFSDKASLAMELEWEHATSSGGSISVEMAQLDYQLKNDLTLRVGLLLAPVGFVNELHEPTTYLGNQRPEVERQVIPSTWREGGVGIAGRVGDKLAYRAYVMNGLRGSKFSSSGLRGGRQKGSRALAEDPSFVVRADYQLDDTWRLGGSYFTGDQGQGEAVTLDAAGTTRTPGTKTSLFEAHLEGRKRGWRTRALAAWARVSDATVLSQAQAFAGNGPVAERIRGGYLELSYDLFTGKPGPEGRRLDAFFRFERYDTQDQVPLGFARDATKDVTVRTWGLQYQPGDNLIYKLDFSDRSNAAGTRVADLLRLGFGWAF